ncbi:MAG: SIMPL domain-containing protein [Deltaproteobacteria bacterium]|nr:SIMPL domain-containing protein [Deltaproteobacteria bacterium]MBW2284298.1 SIMPL domain-containing protein [Deltaproteobacteria bacterium]
MKNTPKASASGLLLLGLFLGIAMVLSAYVVSTTLLRIKAANEKITVKGFAEKRVVSDVAVWTGKVVTRSHDLKSAYEKLEKDIARVLDYLKGHGIEPDDMETSSVTTMTRYKQTEKGMATNEVAGYILEQRIEVNSDDVRLISKLSKESTSLIREGIEFMSFPPRYYSSKFDEIKIDLIGAATRNARQRADQFADNSGVKVGSLASASQGVFQVTPVHSTEISGYGRYDTSTIEKSVKAVVTITYSVSRELEGWIR